MVLIFPFFSLCVCCVNRKLNQFSVWEISGKMVHNIYLELSFTSEENMEVPMTKARARLMFVGSGYL